MSRRCREQSLASLLRYLHELDGLLSVKPADRKRDEGWDFDWLVERIAEASAECGFALSPVSVFAVLLTADGTAAGMEIALWNPDGSWSGNAIPEQMTQAERERWRDDVRQHVQRWQRVLRVNEQHTGAPADCPRPGTFAAQQQLAREERDELLRRADSEPHPDLARLYVMVREATGAALAIVRMSRVNAPPNPAGFVAKFVRLEAYVEGLDSLPDPGALLAKWPKEPGFTVALKAGWSVLEASWTFARSIRNACVCGRALHRVPTHGEPYASDRAIGDCGPHIRGWAERAMEELRERSIPLDHVWPKMGEIWRDDQSISMKMHAEYLRATAADGVLAKRAEWVCVTEDEEKVLYRLADSPILLKGPDACTDVPERAGKDALKRLEKQGLVHRPEGKKTGYALTDRGKTQVAQMRTMRAPNAPSKR